GRLRVRHRPGAGARLSAQHASAGGECLTRRFAMPPRRKTTPPVPTDLLALLRACKEEPDDDGPRRVLADWLEDHGPADRGGFVRLQLEIHRLAPGDARGADLSRRQDELLAQHRKEWTGPLGRQTTFQRGLLWYWGPAARLLAPKLSRPSAAAVWAWVECL